MKICLPSPIGQPTIALGGDLKCRPVFADGNEADVLEDVGDLAGPEQQDRLEQVVERFAPELIVCDAHPGYFATGLAERLARERRRRLIKVQHHRAHVAAVCVERGLMDEPVVGLAFDGTGYGDDGAAWGGEFFSGSLRDGFTHGGQFAPLPLPGGDAAVRAPWRTALALLIERGAGPEVLQRWLQVRRVPLQDLTLFRAGLRAKLALGVSTSVGRWFDAVAALLGVRIVADFEAQGAMELQQMAEANRYDQAGSDWPLEIVAKERLWKVDFPQLVESALQPAEAAPKLSYAFHVATACASAEVARRLAKSCGAAKVIVSGGVFLNRLFDSLLAEEIAAHGLRYVKPKQLPPGDQAIALGQIGLVLAGTGKLFGSS